MCIYIIYSYIWGKLAIIFLNLNLRGFGGGDSVTKPFGSSRAPGVVKNIPNRQSPFANYATKPGLVARW